MRTRNLTVLALSLTAAAGACAAGSSGPETPAPARVAAGTDPRVGLRGGWMDAESAARNLVHLANRRPSDGFFNPGDPGDFAFANSDLAFQGNLVFQGGYNGLQVWDISDPRNPRLRTSLVCPGGQGDVSVYGNLLFMSVEETRGRVDCGTQGVRDTVSAERFMGVRIFDISDLDNPRQVAAVQTCRGSHTHTLVTDPNDPAHIYVYVQGTSRVRPAAELAGCSGLPPERDPNTSYFRIEVIRVPLAAPQNAEIVNEPRIFADARTGEIAGLWPGGDHGPGTQQTARTDQCHDITAYPAIGLAAGACSGNGILLDIRDPANPRRIAEVTDPNFAYWHSATFNNDGTTVLFTDEWGGGVAPRCRDTDRPEWGADAIFRLENGALAARPAGYYKVPAPQTAVENCVAHNGSLIPVPGRDIMVQAWYQGGISVFDFTDPANPVEIAFFDRGPVNPDRLTLGGYWSAYWYNGYIIGSEIGRGLDIFELVPSEFLSANEIEAAKLVRFEEFNPQHQPRFEWPASFVVARAYVDQLERSRGLSADRIATVRGALDRAEGQSGEQRRAALRALAAELERDAARSSDAARVRALAGVVRELGGPGAGE
ncbi:MAG TPA: hypothetical protein VF192_17405 [Longimicrobiales bacterium]